LFDINPKPKYATSNVAESNLVLLSQNAAEVKKKQSVVDFISRTKFLRNKIQKKHK
jgi:hypothetical protein